MAQPTNRTKRRSNTKVGVKILPVVSLFVLVLLVCGMSVGCQTSNVAYRQGALNSGVTSERLAYRQFQVSQPSPTYRPGAVSQPPQKANKSNIAHFLNPFKFWTNRIDDNDHPSVTNPQDLHHPVHPPPTSEISTDFPGNLPIQSQLLRQDDPPEMIEFATMLDKTDQFSLEQKAEMIELLRRESPAMRGSMIANSMVAIRHSNLEGNSRHLEPASHPIVQVSHVSSIRDNDIGEQPTRLANNSNHELATLESQALSHALFTTGNTQSMIRQVVDDGTQNASTFRISRPRGETDAIPEIDANPTLPTVAAPDDYAALRPQESLKQITGANTPVLMQEDREILSYSQPRPSAEPDSQNREITSNQPADLRQGNRTSGPNGTRIAIVDTNSHIPPIIPSLSDVVDDEYDISNVPQKLENTTNTRFADVDPVRLTVQSHAGNVDATGLPDLQVASQLQNPKPPFLQERWDETARRALNLLNVQIADSDILDHKDQLHNEIHQRLMSLTLGNQRDAIKPIDGLPPELQEFWRNALLGLSTMLDDVSFPNSSYRFDAVHSHLQTANLYLQNLCPVRIRKACFINQCDGFGVYETAPNEFQRGEPIFIYAEIDNLTCRKSEGGYLTQVNSSYEILDVFGNRVASGEFSKTGKYTQSRIRDIFLLWRVDLPENIMPGKYFINLSVVDTNHQNYPLDQQRLELNILSPLSNQNNR